jgi:predicted DNA-binding transcriptional regulator AlpA
MSESIRGHIAADKKASAIADIETLIKGGTRTLAAMDEVAERTGISRRSLYTYLNKTRGIKADEWESALKRKESAPRPRVRCHPDALQRFLELGRSGAGAKACYRQMMAEAEVNGWSPIPSERTLSRELNRQVSWQDRYMARRAAKPNGKV